MKICSSVEIATMRQALRQRETPAAIMRSSRGSTKAGVGRLVRWLQAETIRLAMELYKETDRPVKAQVLSAIPIIAREPHFNH